MTLRGPCQRGEWALEDTAIEQRTVSAWMIRAAAWLLPRERWRKGCTVFGLDLSASQSRPWL